MKVPLRALLEGIYRGSVGFKDKEVNILADHISQVRVPRCKNFYNMQQSHMQINIAPIFQ